MTSIKLESGDAQKIYALYSTYQSQIAVLQLILNDNTDKISSDFLQRQWDEARKNWFELETEKIYLNEKYYPNDGKIYVKYDFNFLHELMNFYIEGEQL